MFSYLLKNLSILKKFLFINFVIFTIIGLFTIIFKNVQPNLIKKKSSNHINIIDNTIDNLSRLDVKFNEKILESFYFLQDLFFKT
jgi:two-component system sensor histidine kinase ChvG